MMGKISDFYGRFKRMFVEKDPYRFLIGSMDADIAKGIFKDIDEKVEFFYGKGWGKARGIGVSEYNAYLFIDFADQHALEGKWAVDVWGMLRDYSRVICRIKDIASKDRPDTNPDIACSYASRVFADAAVLEEVCHAMGYEHECDNDGVKDFFEELARESHNVM